MIRNPLSPAVAALLMAMSPGDFAEVDRCRSLEWTLRSLSGERVEIDWRCKPAEMKRAKELAATANDREFYLPGGIASEISMELDGNVLKLRALIVDDDG